MSAPPNDRNEEEQPEQEFQPALHHPFAPSHELFDISTTVDPSYVISLIRKLLPSNVRNENNFEGSENGKAQTILDNEAEAMEIVEDNQEKSTVEKAWEEYGCTLWDLAGNETHAELMVQNLILEVLLANLAVSHSARITEICLGILANLACHEVPQKKIASTNGLINTILDQLFSDDTPCLCETSRLIMLCLQGIESVVWAEVLNSEHILSRIIWITENTLNPQLLEKSLGLLLAIAESHSVLLPLLLKLGISSLLINLLETEMSKLSMEEKMFDRYTILDLILRTIEAISVLDEYSKQVTLNEELFQLLSDLIKLPDKIEVSNSCITASVLIANILTDVPDQSSKISQDILFFKGLFEIFPFTNDDNEAQSALWSIIARIVFQVKESEISIARLNQYVSVFVSKLEVIEEELLLDEELDKSLRSGVILIAKFTSVNKICDILKLWRSLNVQARDSDLEEEDCINGGDVEKLLNCCQKYVRYFEMD